MGKRQTTTRMVAIMITKDKVVQKLAEMFEEEWYTNRSQYEDDDGNETKEFKELQEIEIKVFEIIKEYYGKNWKKEKKREVADFFGGEVNDKV